MASPQLGFHTTGTDVIEAFGPAIAGKTVVITGPTPGSLGAATVEKLASHPEHKPANIILLGRSEQKTQPLIAKSKYMPSLSLNHHANSIFSSRAFPNHESHICPCRTFKS